MILKDKMAKSQTKINKQLERKANPILAETILKAKKLEGWKKVAEILVGSTRRRPNANLDELNSIEGKIIVVPGKVLSQGEVNKKIKVVALGFSERAKEKLLNAGCEVSIILDEIKSNPEGKGIEVFAKK